MKKESIILLFIIILIIIVGIIFSMTLHYNNYSHYHNYNSNSFDLKYVNEIANKPDSLPNPIKENTSKNRTINLETKEVIYEKDGVKNLYWTFNGTTPGPFLRIKQGDNVTINLKNHNSSQFTHSIDLHAVNGPGGGAEKTQVNPGVEKNFSFEALNPGLYIYHCATPSVVHHIVNGMYGLILVEPKEGLKKVDKEFFIIQGEIYWNEKQNEISKINNTRISEENPTEIIFNGRKNALVDYPLNVSKNDSVRLYIGNAGISKISSFHIIGEVFDRVFPEGSTNIPHENVQSTLVPAGGSTIVEFNATKKGDYTFVDHALARFQKGAYGIIKIN